MGSLGLVAGVGPVACAATQGAAVGISGVFWDGAASPCVVTEAQFLVGVSCDESAILVVTGDRPAFRKFVFRAVTGTMGFASASGTAAEGCGKSSAARRKGRVTGVPSSRFVLTVGTPGVGCNGR